MMRVTDQMFPYCASCRRLVILCKSFYDLRIRSSATRCVPSAPLLVSRISYLVIVFDTLESSPDDALAKFQMFHFVSPRHCSNKFAQERAVVRGIDSCWADFDFLKVPNSVYP